MRDNRKPELGEIQYVKLVTVGSINPNTPLSDKSREEQGELLNRCLSDYPRGIIIGKDVSIGRYMVGEHQITMERITYHVGFQRKPIWDEKEGK